MAQNTSSNVMQQCADPADVLQYFPTPPWATRALCEHLAATDPIDDLAAWEPACGEGHMSRPLGEYFSQVGSTDVHDYSETFSGQDAVFDFLIDWDLPPAMLANPPDWIITNFPFSLGFEFIEQARKIAKIGCAFICRTSFLEGIERHKSLFSVAPPAEILQFAERVPMHKGRLEREGKTATTYCWIIFRAGHDGPTIFSWIPPSRKRLDRATDWIAQRDAPPVSIPLFEVQK